MWEACCDVLEWLVEQHYGAMMIRGSAVGAELQSTYRLIDKRPRRVNVVVQMKEALPRRSVVC